MKCDDGSYGWEGKRRSGAANTACRCGIVVNLR